MNTLDKAKNLTRAKEYTHKNGCTLPSSNEIRTYLAVAVDPVSTAFSVEQLLVDNEIKKIDTLLTEYNVQKISRTSLVELLIKVFNSICQADDLERAIKLFQMEISYLVKEPFYKQLEIWGELENLSELCLKFLRLLNNRYARLVKEDTAQNEIDRIQFFRVECLNSLALVAYIRGDIGDSETYYIESQAIINTINFDDNPNNKIHVQVKPAIGRINNLIVLGDKIENIPSYTSHVYFISA